MNLLQHVYGDTYRYLTASYLKKEIKGGDALSAYMINLMKNLDGFVQNVSSLSDGNIADVMPSLIDSLLQSTGLTPLQPLLFSNSPIDAAKVLDVASKLGRLNQHIFTFNESDPTMPELERLIMQFLSLEGNLTLSIPHIMGHTLLTYSDYFHPDDVARFREAIQPFTNQTSAGIVEAILSAMELLKTVLDSPNGDPTNIIIGYIRQLQEFVVSLYRLRKIEHHLLPNGQVSTAQVTDLHLLSKDFLNLLTPEALQNLTQAGPDAAQNLVIQKFVAFLPPEVQQEAALFLHDFKSLQDQMTSCATGQDCLTGISEIFTFIDQILDMMLSANGSVTIKLASPNSVLGGKERNEIASMFFSLLLSPRDTSNVETFKQTLHFIRHVMATPNITVSQIQNALRQSNLTLEELNHIAAIVGAANINDLLVNIMEIANARKCFEPQHNQTVTAQCVMELINGVSGFLTHIPALQNETAILSFIPLIVNRAISDVIQVDFSSNPMALVHVLNITLANIKTNLHLTHLNTPEIMNEIKVMEGLLTVATNSETLNRIFGIINASSTENPMEIQKAYLEIVEWYLKKLENVTSKSSFSDLLNPFFTLTQMQVTLQLAQADLNLFVEDQVDNLISNLQYPIDGAGVIQIGQTTVEILQGVLENIKSNLLVQNDIAQSLGSEPIINTTLVHAAEFQIKLYLNLIQQWMKQPNVTSVLTSMLQWGNSSMNISTPVTDIHHLLKTMVHFLSDDQLTYLSIIGNITQSLSKALMVAEQPGGLQSDHFLAAILEALQNAMQVLTASTGPLPLSAQQNIQEIVQDSLKLILQPDLSFASSVNISLLILKRAESVIQQIVPEMFAEYLLSGIKVVTAYFENISTASGQDNLNQM